MNSGTRFLGALALALSVAGLPASAEAQSDDWEFTIAPYFLFGNLEGDVGILTQEAIPVDIGFDEIMENLQGAVIIHTEVWKSGWGVMGDLIWMGIGKDLDTPGPLPLVLDVQVDQFIIEGFVAHRFARPGRQLDLFAGVRVWDISIDLELEETDRAQTFGDTWVDPVVGGRVLQDVSEAMFLSARGDIGGFGAGSEFSWNLQGGIGYEAYDWLDLVLQYKALWVDFDNEKTGVDFLSWDTVTHGPLISLVFKFRAQRPHPGRVGPTHRPSGTRRAAFGRSLSRTTKVYYRPLPTTPSIAA